MTLKDQIEADRDAVFLNTDEFAELAVVDGREVKIILDEDSLNEKTDEYAKGLSQGDILIFVKKEDLNREPNINDQITVKGRKWFVRHRLLNFGLYEIRLGRNQGNAR